MKPVYRNAVPADAAACVELRGKTRENALSVEQLKAIGVTVETGSGGIGDGSLAGWVCLLGCSADPKTRSYGFYRHLGWRSTGTLDAAQDEVLEYRSAATHSMPASR